jgi:hypothetical protein
MARRKRETAWRRAEQQVKTWLKYRGIDSTAARYKDAYDLLTDNGQTIEVKYSAFITKADGWQGWALNPHRHNILDETEVDWYVGVLGGDPSGVFGKYPINLVIPAPIEIKSLQISPRSLVSRWAGYVNNWRGLVAAEQAAA